MPTRRCITIPTAPVSTSSILPTSSARRRVIDARGDDPLCGFDEIAAALDGAPPRLLFRLMERLDPMVWPTGFRALAPDAVERLARAASG